MPASDMPPGLEIGEAEEGCVEDDDARQSVEVLEGNRLGRKEKVGGVKERIFNVSARRANKAQGWKEACVSERRTVRRKLLGMTPGELVLVLMQMHRRMGMAWHDYYLLPGRRV